ncbi:MAG: bifunctional precorrin-2 dehydrogenase/sirohydrochlorin ferrochelatase [Proteobacteria bacterium]|nr:bifunctional precorrin-2 dehydrogenase/sirohydrochlorin ferrochelatase [Pseudomonadota bacterium]
MEFLPVLVDIENAPCLIVGGGLVAERKIETIIDYCPKIEVVSPKVTDYIRKLNEEGKIIWHKRNFEKSDIDGKFIVFVATDDIALNKEIARICKEKRIIVNCVKPGLSGNCIMPSFSNCDGMIISVSTLGQFPLIAKKFREEMEERAEKYRKLLNLLVPYREHLLTLSTDSNYNKKLWHDFFSYPVMEKLEEGNLEEVNKYIRDFFKKIGF